MRIKIFYIIFIITKIYAQNIPLYLKLLEEGKVDGVKESLIELESKYPNDSGVLYLRALLTQDGNKSIEYYKDLIQRFPDSNYTPKAAMKICEYFYSRGLYTQATKILKKIPLQYPRYDNIQRVTDLMVSSFNAIGEADSARYYALLIKSMFPKINTAEYDLNISNKKMANIISLDKSEKIDGAYVLQVGAFSDIDNAKRLKLQISQLGHNVLINEVQSRGKTLHAVRVGRFKSKNKADKIGIDIKRKIGVSYKVLYRPIKY